MRTCNGDPHAEQEEGGACGSGAASSNAGKGRTANHRIDAILRDRGASNERDLQQVMARIEGCAQYGRT